MYNILAFSYEFAAEFVPFLIVLMLFRRVCGKDMPRGSKRYYVLSIVFSFYIMAVFYVTNPGTIYDAVTLKYERLLKHVNLIPFSNRIDVAGYLLNIVMFIPLGFLVPLIWKKAGKPRYIILTGFAFSLLIELSQLLNSRGTDVDDLILNTLGGVVGFLLYKVWDRVTKSKYQLDGMDTMELPVYILAIYLGRFLLFNRVGLIELLYGY